MQLKDLRQKLVFRNYNEINFFVEISRSIFSGTYTSIIPNKSCFTVLTSQPENIYTHFTMI